MEKTITEGIILPLQQRIANITEFLSYGGIGSK